MRQKYSIIRHVYIHMYYIHLITSISDHYVCALTLV